MYHLSDQEFAQQFADCTLDPKLFTHEAHLRLAWIHVNQYGVARAIQNIRSQIAAFDKAFGDGTKYHETVTMAAIHVINHFIRKSSSADFRGFMTEFPYLRTHFKDILSQHYSIDVFSNADARKNYIQPDLLPFDPVPVL